MRFGRMLWLVLSISLIVLGVVCIANPLDTMEFLAFLVGEIVYFVQMRYVMILLDGLISCVFGLVLLLGGDEISQNFIPLFIALWLILKGILWFIHSYRLTPFVTANLRVSIMTMGGVYILLGILFVIFPEILAMLISLALGIVLILSGIVGLYFWYILLKSE